MARRASTTPIGSIAGGDLSEVGAGKEGWLVSNPNLLTALDTHYLAIANKLRVSFCPVLQTQYHFCPA
ncbi:unnamed protein product [Rhodiola kirilowii]